MTQFLDQHGLKDMDARLLQEALRRACGTQRNAGLDPQVVLGRIIEAALQGKRDMFALYSAGIRNSMDLAEDIGQSARAA